MARPQPQPLIQPRGRLVAWELDPKDSQQESDKEILGCGGAFPLIWDRRIYEYLLPGKLFDTIVYIHVGSAPEKKVFGMHKGLLCFHSGYFKAALTGPFSEKNRAEAEVAVVLEDEDIETFQHFNEWVYSGLFCTGWTMSQLLELFIFAERRLIERLMNSLFDYLTIKTEDNGEIFTTPQFVHAWESSLKIRPFLADAFVTKGNLDGADALPGDFLAEIVRRMGGLYRQGPGVKVDAQIMQIVRPFQRICERYHMHQTKDQKCEDDNQNY